jgi:release factor glutamine methyltransferase
VGALLDHASLILSEAGVEEPRLNARLLLSHVLGIQHTVVDTRKRDSVDSEVTGRFMTLIERRRLREPLQYIIGEVEFMGLKFLVNTDVLIPRPETEVLVEKALECLKLPGARPLVLDIGTGSGNIALALGHFRPDIEILAVDISPLALKVAGLNQQTLGVRNVTLRHADILDGFPVGTKFDMIVSNPPYVSNEEFDSLQPEIRMFEPRIATTDEGDGLRYIRRILEISLRHLNPRGAVLIELGQGQSETARDFATSLGLADPCIHPDLSGIPRVLQARKGNAA